MDVIRSYVDDAVSYVREKVGMTPGRFDPDHETGESMYNPEMETLEPGELDDVIERRLRWTLEYAAESSEYWGERLDEAGIDPQEVEGPEDLLGLDPLDKEAFLERQPPESDDYEWFVDPEGKSSHAHCTSGTTGVEKWFFVNEDDAKMSDESVRRGYAASEMDGETVLANFLPKGPYMSGKQSEDAADGYVKMHQAFGHMNTPPRDRLLSQFKGTEAAPDAFFAAPSTAERIARELEEYGEDPAELGVESIMLVGEPSSETRREAIAETYDAEVTNNYANTELGFTAYQSTGCDVDGMHVIEDLKLVMVVDEEERELVDEGERGEVWVTPLYPEGFEGSTPVINYKPGDGARDLGREACGCGRTHRMITDVGRSDDAVTANNAKIQPHHVEDIIHREHYRDVLTGEYEVEIRSEEEKDLINIRADVREIEDYDELREDALRFVDGEDEPDVLYDLIADSVKEEFMDAHVAPRAFSQGDLMDVEVEIVDNGELKLYDEPGKPERIRVLE